MIDIDVWDPALDDDDGWEWADLNEEDVAEY